MIQAILQMVCCVCLPVFAQPVDLSLLHQKRIALVVGEAMGETLAQSDPRSAKDFYDLGLEAHRAGNLDAAIEAYQTAIRLDSKFDAAYVNLGLALIQLGQLENASAIFHQVLTLRDRPEVPASIHTIAHYNLAIILERQGKTDEAITEVQQALTITPDFEMAQQLLQRLQ